MSPTNPPESPYAARFRPMPVGYTAVHPVEGETFLLFVDPA
jgi:hypothetical protein